MVSNHKKILHTVSEPLTNRGVLLSTLLQDILHPSHHLLNVLLQIANKLGLYAKKINSFHTFKVLTSVLTPQMPLAVAV
jgi:hypothetical protein